MSFNGGILVNLLCLLLNLERESQLRATQEQAEQEIDKAWVHVKELQQRENQLKVRCEVKNFSHDCV